MEPLCRTSILILANLMRELYLLIQIPITITGYGSGFSHLTIQRHPTRSLSGLMGARDALPSMAYFKRTANFYGSRGHMPQYSTRMLLLTLPIWYVLGYCNAHYLANCYRSILISRSQRGSRLAMSLSTMSRMWQNTSSGFGRTL